MNEEAIAASVLAAAEAREPLLVQGRGSKLGMLRPVQAARSLSTRDLTGITLYAPQELIISARAGTTLPELEARLSASGQHLIAEPPDLSGLLGDGVQTIGGVVATNLSGPRRVAWGAMRDHVMGVRAVNGRGEVIRSGGRVLKNVTGLDLCKLLTGSHGTLAVLTEITLKVLPAPELTGSLVVPAPDAARGVALLSAALGSPYGVSAAAYLPAEAAERVPELAGRGAVAVVRIEDFAKSVAYRLGRLAEELGGEIVDDPASKAAWRAIRDVVPLRTEPGDAVWRLSVRPTSGPAALAAVEAAGCRGFLDWGGGLVWVAGLPGLHDAVIAAARTSGGTWTVLRAPDAMRAAVDVVPPEPEPLARITRRVKAALDPHGILNPGRVYAGL
ncbi:MAG TPA: FAD-binding protein [Acetobacteraceae bacterium]|nr:FAD-binding protein [Acetobacteraceae bacterium]